MRASSTLFIALPILLASILLPDRSFGSIEEYFELQPPKVWLVEGGLLNEYNLRHQDLYVGIILKSSTSEYRDYMIITEIRKLPEGTTSFLYAIPEKTDLDEEEYIRVPWVPDEAGNYQVRVFLISDSQHPQVLTSVKTGETIIYDDSFQGLVKLSKSACDGFCPTYEVNVFENRTVIFWGHSYITQPGRHAFEIPRHELDNIVDAINEANFFSADFNFTDGGAEGLPVTILEINLDGKWRQVHYFSGGDIPQELADLERTVNDLVDLKGYIRA